jgi:peptide deformylase
MAELKIEMLGAPVLRQEAAEVGEIDADLRTLIDDMFRTMYAAEGIGLAAPQVGVGKRVMVVDVNDDAHPPLALINPRLVEKSSATEKGEEGCLSIPGVSALVERPTRVVVEALDGSGGRVRIEADGLFGRCIQHEIDHLDGVLFIDRLSALKRSMLLKKYRSIQSEEQAERDAPSRRRSG